MTLWDRIRGRDWLETFVAPAVGPQGSEYNPRLFDTSRTACYKRSDLASTRRGDSVKVLITTGIFPPDIGGPATYVPIMAEALTARGASVTILTLSDDPRPDGKAYPFPVIRVPRRRLGIRRMAEVINRIAVLARRHDMLFAPGLPIETALAARCVRKPYVLKVVGDLAWERARVLGRVTDDLETFQTQRYDLSTELHRRAQAWAAGRAARVIVPSVYLRGTVRGWGVPEGRTAVIPNFTPVITTEPCDVSRDADGRGNLPKRSLVITVARLVPWKGIEQVIRAVAALEGIELRIVGEGPDRARLEAVAASVRCPARFLGQVTHAEVLAILRAANVLVLNSGYEGHPHVALEAMALGVPVIARAACGTPELVRHRETGLLLPAGTVPEIAEAIRELLGDSGLRDRLVRQGRTLAASMTLDSTADRTWRVLQEARSEFEKARS
jgi:glycosyltransferase involved in cell wall biosynthesis